jgi:hypothetical protein
MNLDNRKRVLMWALTLFFLYGCCDGKAQVAASVDCREAQGSGCSGQPSTITARAVPGGGLQVAVATGGPVLGMPEASEVVSGEPYQAQAVTEIRQTLADGTHIGQTIVAVVARDREGRTVRSQRLGVDGPFLAFRIPGDHALAAAGAQPPVLTTIFDPVAEEHIDYTSDMRVARVMSFPGSMNVQSSPVSGHSKVSASRQLEDGQVMAFMGPRAGSGVVASGGDNGPAIMAGGGQSADNTEPLGKRTIEGVETMGTRRTWTIPIGAIGNDRALVTTEDTWYSPKLGLVLLSVRDDPRFGRTTYSLTNLRLSSPDEKLFEVPAGYTIEKLPSPLAPFGDSASPPPQ